MDKEEFRLRSGQMRKQAERGDYETAMKIADTIDWRKVGNVSLLSLVSEIYEKNGVYDEAKEVMGLAVDRAPSGKGLLYRLTELSIKAGNLSEAEENCKEFQSLAQSDPRQYLLRYKILKAKNAPAVQMIPLLERYTATEMDEEWLYELAECYYTAGRREECISLCDRITVLFGTGTWVEKAMLLKAEKCGEPLNEYQQSLLDQRDVYAARLKEVAEEYREEDAAPAEPELPAEEEKAGAADSFEKEETSSAGPAAAEAEEDSDEEDSEADEDRKAGQDFIAGGIPSYVMREPMEAIDDGAKPAIQDEIDREIEEHLRMLDEVRERMLGKNVRPAQTALIREQLKAAAEAAEESETEEVSAKPEKRPTEMPAEPEKAETEEVSVKPEQAEPVKQKQPAAVPVQEENAAAKIAAEPEQEETAEMPAEPEQADTKEAAVKPEQAATEKPEPPAAVPVQEEKAAAKVSAKPEQPEIPAETQNMEMTRVLPKIGAKKVPETQEASDVTKVLPDLRNVRKQEPEKKETAVPATPAVSASGKKPGAYNCFIQGRNQEESLQAAIARLRAIHAETGIRNPAAKTKAERINAKGLLVSAEKIAGKDLIIENAGDLTEAGVTGILQFLRQEDGSRTILLADNPLQLTKLAETYPKLAAAFGVFGDAEEMPEEADDVPEEPAVRPEIRKPLEVKKIPDPEKTSAGTPAEKPAAEKDEPEKTAPAKKPEKAAGKGPAAASADAYAEDEMDIDAFAHYASDYAKKIDCVITGKSMLALYERIEIMQEDGVSLTRKNAEALIEEAADKAEKPPLARKIGSLFSRKYDKDGMLILKEEDFIS